MQRVGPYEVVDELGRGGLGVVYRARDPQLGREVALKLLHSFDPAERLRFLEEARALVRARAPGLVTVHAAELVGERPYLVMELVPGRSLEARLAATGPLPPAEAVRIGLQLAGTLERLHAAGVVHRDIKPGNVMLRPDGQPVLLDLGLALLLDRSSRLTRSGEIMGTPGYLPPEQAQGRIAELGPPADVYGLGALLFALLTGVAPFRGGSVLAVLQAVLTEAPAPPSSLTPGLDPRLDRLVLDCLAKRPEERPQLREVQARLAGVSTPAEGRGWRLVGALTVGGSLSLVGLAALVTRQAPPRAVSPTSRPAASQADASPDGAAQWARVGDERLAAGDASGAIEAYTRALMLEPRDPAAYCRRGDAYADRGSPGSVTSALADYGAAMALDPTSAAPWLRRGKLFSRFDRPPLAIADLTRAIQLNPRDPDAWAMRAGQWGPEAPQRAHEDLSRAIELNPRAHWLTQRAEVRLRMGDEEGARADLRQALERSQPGSADRDAVLRGLEALGEALPGDR